MELRGWKVGEVSGGRGVGSGLKKGAAAKWFWLFLWGVASSVLGDHQ